MFKYGVLWKNRNFLTKIWKFVNNPDRMWFEQNLFLMKLDRGLLRRLFGECWSFELTFSSLKIDNFIKKILCFWKYIHFQVILYKYWKKKQNWVCTKSEFAFVTMFKDIFRIPTIRWQSFFTFVDNSFEKNLSCFHFFQLKNSGRLQLS